MYVRRPKISRRLNPIVARRTIVDVPKSLFIVAITGLFRTGHRVLHARDYGVCVHIMHPPPYALWHNITLETRVEFSPVCKVSGGISSAVPHFFYIPRRIIPPTANTILLKRQGEERVGRKKEEEEEEEEAGAGNARAKEAPMK